MTEIICLAIAIILSIIAYILGQKTGWKYWWLLCILVILTIGFANGALYHTFIVETGRHKTFISPVLGKYFYNFAEFFIK